MYTNTGVNVAQVNIPQGYSFVVNLPVDLSSWIANLTTGTPAAFTVLDARNKNGGTEVLRVAQATNNTSCLASMTTASPSPTGATTAGPQKNTIALAVGISIGGFGILCIALIFFWYYRRRRLHEMRPKSFLDLSVDSADPDPSYHTINVHSRALNAQSKVRSRQDTMMSESSGGRSQPFRPSSSQTTPTAESQRATSVSVYTPRSAGHNPSDVVIHRDITQFCRQMAS